MIGRFDFSIAGGHRGHLACADAAPRKKKRGGVPEPTLNVGWWEGGAPKIAQLMIKP